MYSSGVSKRGSGLVMEGDAEGTGGLGEGKGKVAGTRESTTGKGPAVIAGYLFEAGDGVAPTWLVVDGDHDPGLIQAFDKCLDGRLRSSRRFLSRFPEFVFERGETSQDRTQDRFKGIVAHTACG